MGKGEKYGFFFALFIAIISVTCLVLWLNSCKESSRKKAEEHEDRHKRITGLYEEIKVSYNAPHQLRKMFVKDETTTVKTPGEGHISGGFFLFMGSLSGNYKEGTETTRVVTSVRFAWEAVDGTYIITTLPLEKVRIKPIVQAEPPIVSFFLDDLAIAREFREIFQNATSYYDGGEQSIDWGLRRMEADYHDPQVILSKYLRYAVFTVRGQDWPKNINLPVNSNYTN